MQGGRIVDAAAIKAWMKNRYHSLKRTAGSRSLVPGERKERQDFNSSQLKRLLEVRVALFFSLSFLPARACARARSLCLSLSLFLALFLSLSRILSLSLSVSISFIFSLPRTHMRSRSLSMRGSVSICLAVLLSCCLCVSASALASTPVCTSVFV